MLVAADLEHYTLFGAQVCLQHAQPPQASLQRTAR